MTDKELLYAVLHDKETYERALKGLSDEIEIEMSKKSPDYDKIARLSEEYCDITGDNEIIKQRETEHINKILNEVSKLRQKRKHRTRKVLTSIAASVLLFSSCSGSSQNESDNIYSQQTDNSQNINNECEYDSFTHTENTSDFLVTEKQDTDKCYSIDHNEFYEEDKEAILNICNDICKDLKKLYSYDSIIQYDALKEYLKYSVTNSAFDAIPDSTNLYFALQSMTIANKNAVVTGILKDSTGAYGECIIILSNYEGKILLNDIAVDSKGSSDIIYRPDFLHSPYSDFWLDNNYSWIAE